jgi:predicted porin
MKKTLVALAALAATASFAQSTVTLSGTMDLSYANVSGSATSKLTEVNTVSSSIGSATSAINFNAVEDIGGGLKAQAFYAIDPRANINAAAGAVGRHEAYVGLSGGFGNIRLGSINTAALQVNGVSNVFGTATGGAFTNIQQAAGGAIRFDSSLRYDTPTFNGFSANVTYATGNSDATAGGANQSATDIGLSYSNGPLNIGFSSLQRSASDAQSEVTAVANTSFTVAAVAAREKSTFNSIAANYAIGNAKVFAGYGKGEKSSPSVTAATAATSTATATSIGQDTTMARIGATYTMGALTLLGQMSDLEIGTAAKRKATGLRADYALSKRTAAYAVYETYDSGAASANKVDTAAIGVRHTF